jgi:hydrogenase-4 component E
MTSWIDMLIVALVLTNLWLLGSSRLGVYVRLAAVQGVLVGLLPVALAGGVPPLDVLGLSAAAIGVKSVLFPWLMARILRDEQTRREQQPFVGYSACLLLGIAALGAALWISRKLPAAATAAYPFMMPAALFSMFAGLILIITRRKAVTQALGYLVMENGIYVAGVALVPGAPLMVELGVLLDLFVGVFLMGIMIFHIQREFDHIDTDRLAALRDWEGAP